MVNSRDITGNAEYKEKEEENKAQSVHIQTVLKKNNNKMKKIEFLTIIQGLSTKIIFYLNIQSISLE